MARQIERDIVFGSTPGFRPLTLDLHRPAAVGAPVIIFVHGGGWRVGSRRIFYPGVTEDESFGRLVGAGFAVASIDYRLSGEARFPAQLEDVNTALRWVRDAGPAAGVDPSRIVLWGESAGAHLVTLAAFGRSDLRGVVAWYAPSDLSSMPQRDDPAATREALLLGAPIAAAPERARDASPLHHITPGTPPFHLAHGEADDLVPASQSIAFADALRAAGVEVELQLVPGTGHMWQGLAHPDVVFDPALAFAARVTG